MAKYLIINEQHSLFEEQKVLLGEGYETILIPAEGINFKEIREFQYSHGFKRGDVIIFASPIPALLMELSKELWGDNLSSYMEHKYDVLVFHNDKREKKELPNGKVVATVATTGWHLLR